MKSMMIRMMTLDTQTFPRLFVFKFILMFVTVTQVVGKSSTLSYRGWAEPCKPSKKGEYREPEDACELYKGLKCQLYSQGYFCGCDGETYSYDRQSRECRLKIDEVCRFINETTDFELFEQLDRRFKCHERADCVKKNLNKNSLGKCTCKHPYLTSVDSTHCYDVNGSRNNRINVTTFIITLSFVHILRFFYTFVTQKS